MCHMECEMCPVFTVDVRLLGALVNHYELLDFDGLELHSGMW